ncbi:MAG TPA: response regulator [Stellaceae bacterium]|nr:response regulator [Stellaceae bacterium]
MPTTSMGSARPTVLVVDDDPALLDSLKLLLEVDGFAVTTAENGVRGLQAFRNRGPDIVLIDIMMPKLDGIESVRQMRRERPDAKVVVMSGEVGARRLDLQSTVKGLGAAAVLRKPFDPASLAPLLRDVLRQASPADPKIG